jgi:small-conductance mechanosensitive channel
VVNWSYSNQDIQVEVKFGVSYDSDPHRVGELGVAAAKAVARVLTNPEPVCHMVKFGDSSLDFCLRFWISDPANGITNVRGAVLLNLWDAFQRESIEIPFPVRDVRLTSTAKATPKKAKRRRT